MKTLYIAGENPLASYPDKQKVTAALDAVECLIVSELYLTETAAMADIVLPACTIAEKEGTYTATDRRVQYAAAAIPAVGQSRSDFAIFKGLLAALGDSSIPATPAAAFAEISATVAGYQGMTYSSLGEEGSFAPVATKPALVPVANPALSTANGKLALVVGDALYHNGTLSQYGEGPMYVSPEAYLELSRADAARLALADDDQATVTSSAGSVSLKVKVTSRMQEGVVFTPYHFPEAAINTIWHGEPVTWVSVAK